MGSGFTSSSKVDFGLTEATGVKFESPTRMTATAPPGSGTVDVTVTTAGGTSLTGEADHFFYDPIPSLSKIEPGEGPEGGGTSVTITGTGFTTTSTVNFGKSPSPSVKFIRPRSSPRKHRRDRAKWM